MRLRVLGCSGAIAKGCRTTAFLIDHNMLVDAGTGVGDLTLDEMLRIDHVLLTHCHLDHIAALPLMVDAVGALRAQPLQIHALAETIAALKAHVFNGVIWPDFSSIPNAAKPFITFHPIECGQALQIGGKQIEALPAVHTVPATGYAIAGDSGHWVFTGDTEKNQALWARINQLNVAMLVIETSFSNRDSDLATLSRHLSPNSLASELSLMHKARQTPIYITHLKPAEADAIMAEVQQLGLHDPHDPHGQQATPQWDIRLLEAGQAFDI